MSVFQLKNTRLSQMYWWQMPQEEQGAESQPRVKVTHHSGADNIGQLFGGLTNCTIGSITVSVNPTISAVRSCFMEAVENEFNELVKAVDFWLHVYTLYCWISDSYSHVHQQSDISQWSIVSVVTWVLHVILHCTVLSSYDFPGYKLHLYRVYSLYCSLAVIVCHVIT